MARVGAARIFFDVVGTFQADRLIKDSKAKSAVMQAIWLDTLGGISEGAEQIFNQVSDSIEQAMEVFFAYENQLARVRKFYQGEDAEVDRFSDSAIRLGEAFGFTGEEALKASARTAQLKAILGSQEAIIAGTEAGLMMAAVGEMETELGMNRLINLAQQTQMFMGGLEKATYDKMTAEQQGIIVTNAATHALDQLNTVENSSVATMEDITFVLNQFASQAHIAGENVAEMSAKAALLLETGEEVSRAGTGLRMIYQRLGVATGDAAQAVAAAVPHYDAQAVTTKSLTEILRDVQPAYEAMNAEQKRQFAIQIAGARHYIKFLKLMENHDRLTELTTAAIEKQYDAQGDFNMIAETSAFKMKQLEANIFNLKSAIGEELAPAYIDAYKAQEIFLEGMLTLAESSVGKKIASGVLTMAYGYNSVIKPISEMYLKIANLVIALKTYQAVQRSLNQQTEMATGAYMRNVAAKKILNVEGQRAVAIQNAEVTVGKQTWMSTSRKAASEAFYQNQLHATNKAAMVNLKLMRDKANANLAMVQSAGGLVIFEQLAVDSLTAQIKETKGLISASREREKGFINTFTKEQVAYQHRHQAVKNNIKLNSMDLNVRANMISTINANASAMASENQTLSTQYLLLVPLNQEQLENAQHNINQARSTLVKQEAELSYLNTQYVATKQGSAHRATILAEIEAKTAAVAKTREEIVSIEARVMASQQLQKALKAEAATKKGLLAATASMITSQKNAALASKSFSASLMGAAMVLPFFVDEGKQMNAMLVSMAIMAIPMLIKGIKGISAAMKGLSASVATATAGLSIIAGLAITWAAMNVDWFGGKDMAQNEPRDKLAAMNEELFQMASTLAEIKGMGSDLVATGYLAEQLGITGVDWNTIRSDASASAELWAKTSDRYDTLVAGKEAAEALDSDRGDELAATYKVQIDEMQDLYDKARAANKMHEDAMLTQQMKSWSDQEILAYHHGFEMQKRVAEGLQYGTTAGFENVTYGRHTGSFGHKGVYEGEGAVDALTYTFGGFAVEHFGGANYETSGEILEAQYRDEYAKLYDANYDGNQDILNQYAVLSDTYEGYYNDMTKIIEEGTDDMVEALVQGNTSILAEEEAFNSNREELFFGSRANFEGNLYKKVMEGGVESLLMKTELLQTNNFYGLTMDDAVVKVTDGVMNRLSLAGVV